MPLPPLRRESHIQAAILQLLRVHRVPAWRANTGAFMGEYQGKRRFVRFGPKGQADILAVLPPSGRLLAIEVKRPGSKPTVEQVHFLYVIRKAGGVGLVVSSPTEVLDFLQGQGVAQGGPSRREDAAPP